LEAAFADFFGDRSPAIDRQTTAVPQIYETLRKMIMQLRLEPGTAISKDDIARAFGVSSMPVREAFRKLAEDGLVVIKPQSGTYVAAIDAELARAAQFLRIGVEIEVAKALCETATESEIKELDQLLRHERLELESGDREAFNGIDAAFHARLCAKAGVPVLWEKIGEMRVHIDRLRMMYLPVSGDMGRIQSEHEEILDSIRARDPGRAEAAVRTHLSWTLSAFDKLREENPQYF
jgi:DNA-binding GntR family transcriptional regulator